MPIEFRANEAALSGSCQAEEALELSEWLAGRERPSVDLAACSHLHTSLVQTLLAYRPAISAAPNDPFLARWVTPLITSVRDTA